MKTSLIPPSSSTTRSGWQWQKKLYFAPKKKKTLVGNKGLEKKRGLGFFHKEERRDPTKGGPPLPRSQNILVTETAGVETRRGRRRKKWKHTDQKSLSNSCFPALFIVFLFLFFLYENGKV